MSGPGSHPQRQPHIDGLRAIAVLAVIVYHANAAWLPGGFVGVDVFFVISGYLITGILLRGIGDRSLSIATFYSRRAKRILPAAFAVIAVTMLVGMLFLAPPSYADLARSAVASIAFVANYWFASQDGYFDASTELAPLAHLWSLGVEEQFYLLFPLLLVLAMKRWGRRGAATLVFAGGITSLVLCVLATDAMPVTSYYVLHTRAWQLLAGAALHFLPRVREHQPWLAGGIAAIGAAALATSLCAFTAFTPYPGTAALLPTLGTAALIAAAPRAAVFNALLSHPVLRRIGDSSYSAYLWHWPIIVYYRIYVGERPFEALESGVLIALSLASGFLSWRLVEEPLRNHRAAPARVAASALAAASCIALGCWFVIGSHGLSGRIDAATLRLTTTEGMWRWQCPANLTGSAFSCVVGERWSAARVHGVLWGDSHAEHWAPVFDAVARREGIALGLVRSDGCAPYIDGTTVRVVMPRKPDYTGNCARSQAAMREWFDQHSEIRLVVLTNSWSNRIRTIVPPAGTDPRTEFANAARSRLAEEGLVKLLQSIATPGRKVLLLGDAPIPRRKLNDCITARQAGLLREGCAIDAKGLNAPDIRQWHLPSERALRRAAARVPGVSFISTVERFCSPTHCPLRVQGEWIYMDDGHLRRDVAPATHAEMARMLGIAEYLRGVNTDPAMRSTRQ